MTETRLSQEHPQTFIPREKHIQCTFSFAALAHHTDRLPVFAVFSPHSLCCSVITEQKWNKDHCGTSPGCLRRGCESTAVFHIKPKILGPHCCLVCLYHFQESSTLLTGVNTFS